MKLYTKICLAVVAGALALAPLSAAQDGSGETPPSDTPPTQEPACELVLSEGAGTFVGMVDDHLFANPDPDYRSCSLSKHADAGVRIIRQALLWADIEKKKNQYDWAYWDAYVADVARHGVELMPIIFDAPRWRQQRQRRTNTYGETPPTKAAMARFVRILVQRYGPEGRFWDENPYVPRVPIRVWQIWNEPNLARYWFTRPNAKEYVALLRSAYKSIKRHDPDAEVVAAGMPDSRLKRTIPLYSYIHQMYAAGAKGTFDALAINAYAETPDLMLKNLSKVRRVMEFYGDDTGFWITEMGWGTGGPKYRFRVSKSRQAKYLKRSLNLLEAERRDLGLHGFIHYTMQDALPYGDTPDFWGLHTGLLDLQGREKPAYPAFRKIARRLRWIR